MTSSAGPSIVSKTDFNLAENQGIVFNIQRFSLHDGPGLRTIIFLKGCPLRCMWCSNPESHQKIPQITYDHRICKRCGQCIEICPFKALCFNSDGFIEMDMNRCDQCGACARSCRTGALKVVGGVYSVEDVLRVIEKDSIFYRRSGGGATLGGGEPLFQSGFAVNILRGLKEINIETAIETSGYAPWESLVKVYPLLDVIYYDLKHVNSVKHKKLTGVSNKIIKENLINLSKLHPNVIVRYPFIPGCNDSTEDISALASFLKLHVRNPKVELSPYHRFGEYKYRMLWRKYLLEGVEQPSKARVDRALNLIRSAGVECISLH